jgi:hypothetical protein
MPYDVRVRMPGGNVAFLRMAGKRPRPCRCGADATRLCDWITARGVKLRRRCSEPLCDSCTSSPAPGKDLCPTHAGEWKARQAPQSC